MSDIEIIKKYGSIENYIYELESENKQLKEDYNKAVHNSTEFESEVYELKEQLKQRDEVIDETINDINLAIELIKQQPTNDDSWILGRLNGFKYILQRYKGDNNE